MLRTRAFSPSIGVLVLAACGVYACQSSSSSSDSGLVDGHLASCALDPPGTFTFRVHNVGSHTLSWSMGCGRTLPIVLHLPEGDLPIGPGTVDVCEFTCDEVYTRGGPRPDGCTDCGGGGGDVVMLGGTQQISWDRRVYVRHPFDPACRPDLATPLSGTCALGRSVTPSATQSGAISVCDGLSTFGSCEDSATGTFLAARQVEFTVDTSGAEAVIEIQ